MTAGDLAYLSKKAKEMLDEAGFSDAIISASSDLDENLINSLKTQGATINSWGVGTNMITSSDWPAFGGVYKLVALKDEKTGNSSPRSSSPRIQKRSPTPATRPFTGSTAPIRER